MTEAQRVLLEMAADHHHVSVSLTSKATAAMAGDLEYLGYLKLRDANGQVANYYITEKGRAALKERK